MNIHIETIPHKNQRYPTCGDYFHDDKKNMDHILVSELDNEDMEFLISLHELVEMYLCEKRGIKEKDITAFDIMFEKERGEGNHSERDEPGDDERAPYRKEHFFATNIERLMAEQLGVDWDTYENACINL